MFMSHIAILILILVKVFITNESHYRTPNKLTTKLEPIGRPEPDRSTPHKSTSIGQPDPNPTNPANLYKSTTLSESAERPTPPPSNTLPKTTTKSTVSLGPYQQNPHIGSSPEPCRDGNCRSPPNLLGPIVGALCGIFILILIIIFIIWFYIRRKNKKKQTTQIIPTVKFIEYPALYTGAISTTDSTSRLYGMSPTRNDSISSHHYEKIHYNEQS